MNEEMRKWVEQKIDQAQQLFDEAEDARDESDYTDIDALEQSCYNDGVVTVLSELLDRFKS